MKKISFTILFLLLINFTYSQNDEDFTYIATEKNETKYYIHFEKEGIISKEYWVKRIFPTKTIKNKKGKYVTTGGGYDFVYLEINCENKTYSTSDSIRYDSKGNVIARDYSNEFNSKIIPGSVLFNIYGKICN